MNELSYIVLMYSVVMVNMRDHRKLTFSGMTQSLSCSWQPYLYLYLFFGVDDSIEDVFTQRGDHSSGPMLNPKLTGMVM